MDLTLNDAKTAARALRRSLAATDVTISHGRALEIVSRRVRPCPLRRHQVSEIAMPVSVLIACDR